ncbi:MAG TPA: hypothetical protein VJH33_03680 [Candidatus Paceibacterota bacterium]
MSNTLATKHVAAVLIGLGLVLSVFAFATPAQAATLDELQAQINALLAQIATLQAASAGGGTGFTFTRNHSMGDSGGEVMNLQKFLNSMSDTQVASSGAGSPGNESSYFGAKTKAAVMKFQNKYASDILAPVGLSAGTGYWGASSRTKANAMGGGASTGTGSVPVVAGGGLTVSAGVQAANQLAPEGASQIPFTVFKLTNNSSSEVTVDTVTVERVGYAANAVFAGLILVDGSTRLGSTKSLNSNNQATLTAGVKVGAGQTKTLTVAGDMAVGSTALNDYAGQLVQVSVVGVNTSATVSGSLPITGSTHTINSTLSIGSLAMTQGASDPDASATKEIGITNYTFASVRATAGSAEDIWVKSIRWNQAGAAGKTDIANIVVRVDGTDYPTSVTDDGKYYTATFAGNGLEIVKGAQKEFEVRGDLISGTNRTVRFDLYRANDIYAVGEIYGYGVTPTQSESGTAANATSEFTSGTPFFDGSQVTISAGTVSSVSRANEVPAQNVAENTPNQVLGGFVIDLKGEAITVAQQVYHYQITGSGGQGNDLTSVTLVDENGKVVAGPVDGATAAAYGSATFTDTVTFPTGRHVYTLKGKYGTDFTNGQTLIASTTASSDWTTVKGVVTGDTISLSSLSSVVTGNTMTLRAGSVALSVNPIPAAQNIVAGSVNVLLGQYNFDGTQSGEDVRFTTGKFYYDEVTTMAIDPTNCFAYDGATKLNDTAVNPDADGDDTYTFDRNLLIPKGTVKVIAVKCDIPGSASTGTFAFDLNTSSGNGTFDGTGVDSGTTVTPTTPSTSITDGQTMTVSSGGALTVALDSSSPAYAIAVAGASNVTLGTYRFTGTNEDQRLDRIALEMSNVAASSSPGNLTKVSLWDGANKVGEATFAATRFATSTLVTTDYDADGFAGVKVPKDGYRVITVKGDLANIGTGLAGTQGAFIEVDYDGNDTTGTRSMGVASGTTINQGSSSDTNVLGVRVFRTVPTVAQVTGTCVTGAGTLSTAAAKAVHCFSIGANAARDVGLYKLVINVATSSADAVTGTTTVENLDIYAYTDSAMSQVVPGYTDGLVYDGTDGQIISGDNDAALSSILQIPAGSTYYFKVLLDVTRTNGTGTYAGFLTTKLAGDSAYVIGNTVSGLMAQAATVDLAANTDDDFIWSPNATTTAVAASLDWTNGYSIPGLPSSGLTGHTLSP